MPTGGPGSCLPSSRMQSGGRRGLRRSEGEGGAMLDAEIINMLNETKNKCPDRVLDIMLLSAMVIPWGSECCHGCEFYECGKSITAYGYCPIQRRRVSPHYFCEQYEQD